MASLTLIGAILSLAVLGVPVLNSEVTSIDASCGFNRAVIIESNLPPEEQIYMADQAKIIFDRTVNAKQRAMELQAAVNGYKPFFNNFVIVGYEAAAYFESYFVFLMINGVQVVVFGHSC